MISKALVKIVLEHFNNSRSCSPTLTKSCFNIPPSSQLSDYYSSQVRTFKTVSNLIQIQNTLHTLSVFSSIQYTNDSTQSHIVSMGNLRGTKISASASMKSRIKKNKQFKIIKDQIEDKTRKEKQVLSIYCTQLFRSKYTLLFFNHPSPPQKVNFYKVFQTYF